jgi:hypothetical protein
MLATASCQRSSTGFFSPTGDRTGTTLRLPDGLTTRLTGPPAERCGRNAALPESDRCVALVIRRNPERIHGCPIVCPRRPPKLTVGELYCQQRKNAVEIQCVAKSGDVPQCGDGNKSNIRVGVFRQSSAPVLNPCPIRFVKCRADEGLLNPSGESDSNSRCRSFRKRTGGCPSSHV